MSRQALNWLPDSYYRLRDSGLVAHITAVEADRLRGEIAPIGTLTWINTNGQPRLDRSAVCAAGEWDLQGDCRRNAAHDLMQLIR
jgi:hypothetical protein